jgi:multisubunit Na+/H+ antiporter MnhF subunit
MVWSAIVWLAIIFGLLWALFRLIRGPTTNDKRSPEDHESHGPFRK